MKGTVAFQGPDHTVTYSPDLEFKSPHTLGHKSHVITCFESLLFL